MLLDARFNKYYFKDFFLVCIIPCNVNFQEWKINSLFIKFIIQIKNVNVPPHCTQGLFRQLSKQLVPDLLPLNTG
jgi:hypothetical protein